MVHNTLTLTCWQVKFIRLLPGKGSDVEIKLKTGEVI